MSDACDSQIDSDYSAQSKNINGDQQRIKIQCLPVAIRMKSVGGTSTALHAEKQEEFVAGVGRRVNRFGEHRRALGEYSDHKLADRNKDGGCQCHLDHTLGAF